MIKKLILGAVLAIAGVSSVAAQTAGDYKKGEIYVGYSNNQVDSGADSTNSIENFFKDRESFNGFEAAGVYNVGKYVGLKASVSGAYKGNSVDTPITVGTTTGNLRFDVNRSIYNFLGGVQFKNNSTEARFKPFAHALAGAGHVRYKVKNVACTNITPCPYTSDSDSQTGFAAALGGGLDVRAGSRIDVRLIQVDYNPIRIDGSVGHNFRIGAGIVFK